MKSKGFNLLVLLSIFAYGNLMFCQTKTDVSQQAKSRNSSYFSLGINYISDAVYMGRKDSITTPYLYPSITYFNKSGLYATGSFSYLTKSNDSRIDLFLGTIGYDFTSKKFSGDISLTKYFFNTDSYNVISEVEADLTATMAYDFNVFNLSISLTNFFNKSSKSDFFLSSELSHDFVTSKKDFQISPTVGAFWGSQNFYEEYYINNRFGSERTTGSGSGQGTGQGPGGTGDNTGTTETTTTTVVLQESEKFGLMAIEFSLPVWYVNKPFIISFLPVLAIPQNPATLTVDSVVFEEDLENTFFWMLGVSYRF